MYAEAATLKPERIRRLHPRGAHKEKHNEGGTATSPWSVALDRTKIELYESRIEGKKKKFRMGEKSFFLLFVVSDVKKFNSRVGVFIPIGISRTTIVDIYGTQRYFFALCTIPKLKRITTVFPNH